MEKTMHYVLILDQSGSMERIKKAVISSFNQQVEMIRLLQKEHPGRQIRITLCCFNDSIDFRFTGVPVKHLKKLTAKEYQPNFSTALYDAIGASFSRIQGQIQPGEKAFFAIFTDGMENASREYSGQDIEKWIAKAKKQQWEIKFFCRQEEERFYQEQFNLDKNMLMTITMNEEGFCEMAQEVKSSLSRILREE
ncbi:MAG: VWA domain-containing protein [Bacteroidales bacterium]|nr:VWA domain-containing protein [Bacteroidales bacterium]MDD3010473.1 VWA domain-containing protein [Bacteroidales bacterium]MDD3961062.1 VWA domain-containing protein [Bacteroidales bacterium]MDY0286190.1 vWA domain-containing protein [Bacteroidales bacterium]